MKNFKNVGKKQNDKEIEDFDDWEAEQNWFGFFSLLLEADRKMNPHLYKKPKKR